MEKKSKYNLSPKEYNEYLAFIEVDQILLNDSSVKVKRENFDIETDVKLDIKENIQYDNENFDGKSVTVHQTYNLTCYEERKREFAFKITCEFEVIMIQSKPLPKDFWDLFADLNLRVNTWPYFREFVQNMTQRINVPPLTLPLFKA